MNKFIKLLLVFTLVLSLLLAFAACDETEDEQDENGKGSTTSLVLNGENGGNGGDGGNGDNGANNGTTGAGGTTASGKWDVANDNDNGKYGALGTVPR